MRNNKPRSQVTHFLDETGVLSNGTALDIANSKKLYWKQYRKEWRKQQRANCKSCTVFFTASEHRIVTTVMPDTRKNVAGFVKQAALNAARNRKSLAKELIGQVREAFYESYVTIEKLTANLDVTKSIIELERNVLNLIQ